MSDYNKETDYWVNESPDGTHPCLAYGKKYHQIKDAELDAAKASLDRMRAARKKHYEQLYTPQPEVKATPTPVKKQVRMADGKLVDIPWITPIPPEEKARAVNFLIRRYDKKKLREIAKLIMAGGKDWWVPYHYMLGMGVRNALRNGGFKWSSNQFDELWIELIENAVSEPFPVGTPEGMTIPLKEQIIDFILRRILLPLATVLFYVSRIFTKKQT